ncbi:MAG: hypothetical protein E7603_04570 [Ruminococcaceae bacterium]|nr:hypothetical protein [Oscillospiraceae bacterium]
MKRIFTVFLVVFVMAALVFSLSSCNRYGYINQALTKAGTWEAVDFDVKTDVQTTVSEKTEDISSQYSVKIKYLQSYDPLAMAKTRVTLYGETVPADVYFTNGSYYVVTNNDAVKLRTGNLIEGSAFVSDWKNLLTALPSSAVNSAAETDHGDGTKTATMTVDTATFETVYQNALNEWKDKLVKKYGGKVSVSDIRVTEPKIAVTVYSQSGALARYSGECRLEILSEDSTGNLLTVSAVFKQTLSCNANGNDVSVELPEDYESYKISDGLTLDSQKILSAAVKNALALKELDISLRLTLGAESISTKNIQASGIGTDAWNFAWNESFIANDKQVTGEVYYKNGWYYTNMYGELAHLKYERSADTDEAYGYETELLALLKNLADSEYKSASAVSNEDGTRTFTVKLPVTRFQKVYGTLITNAKGIAKISGTVAVSDTAVELIVDKKGVLKSYAVSFALTDKNAEEQTPFTFAYHLAFNDVGESVTVTPLEGYELFFEASERKQEFFGDVTKAIEDILGADSLNAYIYYSQFADAGVPFFQIDKQLESVTAAVDMKTNPKHFTNFAITDQGKKHNESVYFEDGIFYIKSDIEDSFKTKGEYLTEQNAFWMIHMIRMIPEEYFDRISFASEGENNTLSVELTIDELLELFPDVEVVEGISLEVLLGMTSSRNVKESKIIITLNEANELVSYEVKLSADFTVNFVGTKLDCTADLEIYYEFNSDRSEIEITPPEGYKDFQDADADEE